MFGRRKQLDPIADIVIPDVETDEIAPASPARPPAVEPPYLPASVREPGRQRLATSDEDGDDADLEFLTSLASKVADEQRRPKRAAAALARALTQNEKMIDRREDYSLQIFRDSVAAPPRAEQARLLRVDDTDIADVLEDLATTAAALHRRRAA